MIYTLNTHADSNELQGIYRLTRQSMFFLIVVFIGLQLYLPFIVIYAI